MSRRALTVIAGILVSLAMRSSAQAEAEGSDYKNLAKERVIWTGRQYARVFAFEFNPDHDVIAVTAEENSSFDTPDSNPPGLYEIYKKRADEFCKGAGFEESLWPRVTWGNLRDAVGSINGTLYHAATFANPITCIYHP